MANGADNCCPQLTYHKQIPSQELHWLLTNIMPSRCPQVNYVSQFQMVLAVRHPDSLKNSNAPHRYGTLVALKHRAMEPVSEIKIISVKGTICYWYFTVECSKLCAYLLYIITISCVIYMYMFIYSTRTVFFYISHLVVGKCFSVECL